MPVIAEHCRPDGWRCRATPYTPICQWPEDCFVQWGNSGLVIPRNAAPYKTAFFEAFPTQPSTFIRGEGATIEAAERSAFARWVRIEQCRGHEYERGFFRNGAGMCKHCRLFRSHAFEPLTTCATCSKPTYFYREAPAAGREEVWLCEEHAPPEEQRLAAILGEMGVSAEEIAQPECDAPRTAMG